MNQYTRGEWKQQAAVNDNLAVLCGIYHIATVYGRANKEETEANAHLIAAAPDMYEALKEISEGKGAFSFDPLLHASNTIDNMKELALRALAKVEVKDDKV